jgi:hypothetical protein
MPRSRQSSARTTRSGRARRRRSSRAAGRAPKMLFQGGHPGSAASTARGPGDNRESQSRFSAAAQVARNQIVRRRDPRSVAGAGGDQHAHGRHGHEGAWADDVVMGRADHAPRRRSGARSTARRCPAAPQGLSNRGGSGFSLFAEDARVPDQDQRRPLRARSWRLQVRRAASAVGYPGQGALGRSPQLWRATPSRGHPGSQKGDHQPVPGRPAAPRPPAPTSAGLKIADGRGDTLWLRLGSCGRRTKRNPD